MIKWTFPTARSGVHVVEHPDALHTLCCDRRTEGGWQVRDSYRVTCPRWRALEAGLERMREGQP